MAYIKTNWQDQKVERPHTYESNTNADGTITLIDSFGNVEQMGTPVNAQNMNKIEDGIANSATVDLDNLSETGQSKLGANKDLSNLTPTGQAKFDAKLNTNMTNLPATNDIVIEHKVNPDGSWYRQYKSGWLEQGGVVSPSQPNVNLLKPFRDTKYYINKSVQGTNSVATATDGLVLFIEVTTTSFTTATLPYKTRWYAAGQGV